MKKLIIGTRGSDLALWQANYTKDKLAEIGVEAELKIIKTQGDKILNLRLDKLEGKGFFTKELEEELLSGSIDIAVHSHKDLPTTHPAGLTIAAVSEREDASELLLILKDCVDVTQKLSLKTGAQVGTSSNRRKAQLLALRTDLNIEDLRGNVNTRIQKLRDENYDAILLAKAGVNRLNLDLSEFHMEVIDTTELIPAPAQGVLAIQIRENDHELYDVLQGIHDADTAEEIGVERKVLNLFEGGCHMPLGCYCKKENGKYEVWTSKALTADDFPNRLFFRVDSLEGLAEKIVAKYDKDRKLPARVFISREIGEHNYFRRALETNHIEIEGRSLIRTFPIVNVLDPFYLKHINWIFFSSRNGVEYFFKLKPVLPKHVKFGVVGRGSEDALRKHGHKADYVGESGDITEVAEDFAVLVRNQTVLFPRAQDSLLSIQKSLAEDTKVIDLPIYETVIEENIDHTYADVLIFTSPSNVEAYFADNLLDPGQKVIAIGNSTGKKFEEMGVEYVLPYSPDEIGLAEAVFGIDIK
ncbi:hydroxymethylbilane synthase [Pedobacter cryoconitis]|uniref:Porphobilinogen deaminase n=1 Tax=Pedobacter cryoconitis TaxID=188932 RepID=A0A7W8YVV0_9SPHI|nr:hydroxymethylbilane synthase [Pedobacter cryoconitis]MBB5622709.1 hydroxymethylbilane synthase [Pedobacter cryoconitis]MBB5648863.1 hydroxymethylbilane synthase [Pedobacter cryoconitis]